MLSLGWDDLEGVWYRLCNFLDVPTYPEFSTDPEYTTLGPFGSIATSSNNKVTITSGSINNIIPCQHIYNTQILKDGKIAILTQKGSYRLYEDPKSGFNEYTLFTDGIQTASLNDWGIAAVSLGGDLMYAKYGEEAQVLHRVPNALALAFSASHDDQITVYAATTSGISIFTKDSSKTCDLNLPPINIALSPNGKLLALLYTNSLQISPISSPNVPLISHNLLLPSKQLAWCSNDLVAVTNNSGIDLYGPTTTDLHYDIPDSLIRTENDGLLIVSPSESPSFFSKVPIPTQRIFLLGSSEPACILMDALNAADSKSPKSRQLLSLISDNLSMATDDCISAACEELDPDLQKQLLRAAKLGMNTLSFYDPADFVSACDHIRVLNTLRMEGWAITYSQFIDYSFNTIIKTLLSQQKHYLALRICEFLNQPKYKVLNHWAECKIKSDVPDKQLGLMSKLKGMGIDWFNLAKVAYTEGRIEVFNELISKESDSFKKVQLLHEIGDLQGMVANADCDAQLDAILYTLFNLPESQIEFFKLINDHPNIIGVYKSLYSSLVGTLNDFMYQDDDKLGLAILNPSSALNLKQLGNLKQILKNELKVKSLKAELQSQGLDFSNCETTIDLLTTVVKFDLSQALKCFAGLVTKEEISVVVLNVLGAVPSRFEELYEFASKNNVDYNFYTRWFLKRNEKKQAIRYLKLSDFTGREKVKMLILCGLVGEAEAEAEREGDDLLVQQIKLLNV